MDSRTSNVVPCLSEDAESACFDTPMQLESPWTFWFDAYPGPGLSAEQYAAAMKKLGSVTTVQAFWQYYNNLPHPNELNVHTSYHLMKRDSRPLWEDSDNLEGGSLGIKVHKDVSEQVWITLLLCAIGEQFGGVLNENDDIQGVSINVRKQENMIFFWNRRADLINTQKVIDRIKSLLPGVVFLGEPVYRVHKAEVLTSMVTAKPRNKSPPKHQNKHSPSKDHMKSAYQQRALFIDIKQAK